MRSLEQLNNIFNKIKNARNINNDLDFSDFMSLENCVYTYNNNDNHFYNEVKSIESEENYDILQYNFKKQKLELYSLENYYNNFRFIYSEESASDFFKKAFEFLKTIIKKLILHFTTFLKMLTAKILLYTERSKHKFYLKFDEKFFTEDVKIKAMKVKNGHNLVNSNFHKELIESFINNNIQIDDNNILINKEIEKVINNALFMNSKPEEISCLDYINDGFNDSKTAVLLLKDHFIANLRQSHSYVSEYIDTLQKMLKDMDKYKDNLSQEIIDNYQNDKTYIQKLFYANHYLVIAMINIRKKVAEALAKGCAGKLLNEFDLSDEMKKELDLVKNNTKSKIKNIKDIRGATIKTITNELAFEINSDRYRELINNYYLDSTNSCINSKTEDGTNKITLYNFAIPREKTEIISEIEKLFLDVFEVSNIKALQFTVLNQFKMLRNFTLFDKNIANTSGHLSKLDKFYDFLGLIKHTGYDKLNTNITVCRMDKGYSINADPSYYLKPEDKNKYYISLQITQDIVQYNLDENVNLYHTSRNDNLTELRPTYRPSGLRNILYTQGKVFFGLNQIFDRNLSKIIKNKFNFKTHTNSIYKVANIDQIRKTKTVIPDNDASDYYACVVVGDDPIPVINITDAVYAYMLEKQ